jgi:hypothetical protein
MSETKPLTYSSFARLGNISCEWERDGRCSAYFYEPIDVDLPETASPSWGFGAEITFYDRTGNKLLEKHVRVHDLNPIGDTLVFHQETKIWWELASARVIYRNGRWFVRWAGWCNTRKAYMMNVGLPAFQQRPEDVQFMRPLIDALPEASRTEGEQA